MLGESYSAALRRLYSLENNYVKNPKFKIGNSAFMSEYTELRHMSVNFRNDKNVGFYLPHHVNYDLTSKIRLFGGSAKTSTDI